MEIINLKCLVFWKSQNIFKILKFIDRDVAKQYYKIAHHKATFKFAGTLEECIEWCERNKFSYEVIERKEYLISE